MPPPHPPLSRSFWLLQKPLVSTPSPLHQWSPTQSFAFSILAFFHIFRFILSHLLFTCFSSFPPPCFASLLLCGSTEPHLNAQPVISSLPALGIFIGMKKCNHPFSFWYISTRVDTELLKWTDSTLFLHILVVQCMKILIFHSLLCGVARYLVLSCWNRAHRLSSACSLACRQADQERQGRGECKEEGEGSKWGVGKNYGGLEKRAVAQPWIWRERGWGRDRGRKRLYSVKPEDAVLVVVRRADQ